MNNIFSKLRDFVGLNDPVEYEYEYEEEGDNYRNVYEQEHPQPTPEEDIRQRRRARERIAVTTDAGVGSTMNNVIGMPGSANSIYEVEWNRALLKKCRKRFKHCESASLWC